MAGRTYDDLAELPVRVEGWSLERQERATSSGDDRVTTVFALEGDGETGRGEDVTYDPSLHDELATTRPSLDFTAAATLAEASAVLDEVDLFPAGPPERHAFLDYRRWAVESALLDLGLRQAGSDLGSVLDREPDAVRFLVSTGLGDPSSADRVTRWLDIDPSLGFKVDITRPLPQEVCDALIETDAVEAVDLKAQYAHTPEARADETSAWIGDPDPDPGFYRTVLRAFPGAVVEDAAVTDATRHLLVSEVDRLAWDAPIHSVDDFEAQPLAVGHCNVKPSRFGTLERLFDFLDFAAERGLQLYGGGQYEVAVGRGQLHDLASLFYPDGPNDVAPRGYNDPEPRSGLPSSPLEPPAQAPGFGWRLN